MPPPNVDSDADNNDCKDIFSSEEHTSSPTNCSATGFLSPKLELYPQSESTSPKMPPLSPSKSFRLRFDENVIPNPERPQAFRSSSSLFDMRDFGVAPNGTVVASSRRRLRSRSSTSIVLSTSGSELSSIATSAEGLLGTVRKPRPSTRLKNPIEKPWLQYPDRSRRWSNYIFGILVFLGIAVTAFLCYQGYSSIQHPGNLCLIMDDDFSQGIRADYWNHEVQVGGFGNGEFEWTTTSSNNSFVQDGILYLVPTLTELSVGMDAITNGYTLNLTEDGTCTGTNSSQCVQVSNSTLKKVINPVQSARLNTMGKFNITFGKVEVEARMPLGDWLWPAIWMLPVENTYGAWPMSGEIDIVESRGNNFSYGYHGVDWAESTLHWGPTTFIDSWTKTFATAQNKVLGYHSGYHKYTLEWTEDYIATYVDNRVYTVLYLSLKKESFWTRGKYPTFWDNGTLIQQITNPWYAGTNAAPFDQCGTNGWFPDGLSGKPWIDSAPTAMHDFYTAKNQWYPTWPTDPTERGMAVKSVKMWQKC